MVKNQDYKRMLRIVVIGILVYCGIQNYKIVLSILAYLFHLVFPFLLGGAIAFVINVPMRAIEKKLAPNSRKFDKFRRVCAFLITLILIFGVLTLALLVIIPQVRDTIMQVVQVVPGAFNDFQNWLYKTTASIPNLQKYIDEIDIDWKSLSSHAISFLKTTGSTFFTSGISVISSILGGLTTSLIAFIFSIYIVFQKEELGKSAKRALYALLEEEQADRIVKIGRLSQKVFSSFLSGQCIEAVILGSMFFVTLLIFRIPYAVLIGVVIALTALIPVFGAFIGLGIGALLIVMVDPMKALWFIIIFFVLQQIENNLIYPRVVGGSIGLPSIYVLVAVSLGGSLLGVAGVLLFIPFCSVCYALFTEYVEKKLKEKKVEQDKWDNESWNTISDEELDGLVEPKEDKSVTETDKSDDEKDE